LAAAMSAAAPALSPAFSFASARRISGVASFGLSLIASPKSAMAAI
jgi:hypothetical protein